MVMVLPPLHQFLTPHPLSSVGEGAFAEGSSSCPCSLASLGVSLAEVMPTLALGEGHVRCRPLQGAKRHWRREGLNTEGLQHDACAE